MHCGKLCVVIINVKWLKLKIGKKINAIFWRKYLLCRGKSQNVEIAVTNFKVPKTFLQLISPTSFTRQFIFN